MYGSPGLLPGTDVLMISAPVEETKKALALAYAAAQHLETKAAAVGGARAGLGELRLGGALRALVASTQMGTKRSSARCGIERGGALCGEALVGAAAAGASREGLSQDSFPPAWSRAGAWHPLALLPRSLTVCRPLAGWPAAARRAGARADELRGGAEARGQAAERAGRVHRGAPPRARQLW